MPRGQKFAVAKRFTAAGLVCGKTTSNGSTASARKLRACGCRGRRPIRRFAWRVDCSFGIGKTPNSVMPRRVHPAPGTD